jgi:hypothetical protein
MATITGKDSNRRRLVGALAALAILFVPLVPVSTLAEAPSAVDALPSWNDGAAKQAIVDFVKATTDKSSPDFVPPEERIATFDQDGTLWSSIQCIARRSTHNRENTGNVAQNAPSPGVKPVEK